MCVERTESHLFSLAALAAWKIERSKESNGRRSPPRGRAARVVLYVCSSKAPKSGQSFTSFVDLGDECAQGMGMFVLYLTVNFG